MTALSGSSHRPASTWNAPTCIQEKTRSRKAPCAGSACNRSTASTLTTNAASTTPGPTNLTDHGSRRPSKAFQRKPSAGSRMIQRRRPVATTLVVAATWPASTTFTIAAS